MFITKGMKACLQLSSCLHQEDAFGFLKARPQILNETHLNDVEVMTRVITFCCASHDMLKRNNDP